MLLKVGYAVLSIICMYFSLIIWNTNECDVRSNIWALMENFRRTVEPHSIEYYYDYGTLLGLIRDADIIKFEFDCDVAISSNDYQNLYALKDDFLTMHGMYLYGQDEFIFTKAFRLLYFGRWDPYLRNNFPCLRIYDGRMNYYIDVYCNYIVPNRDAAALTHYPPKGLQNISNSDRVLLFNNDDPDTPGGLKFRDWVYPIQKANIKGHVVALPHDANSILELEYGRNWRTPQAKGIKKLICSGPAWLPNLILFILLSVTTFVTIRTVSILLPWLGDANEAWKRVRQGMYMHWYVKKMWDF